MEGLAFFVEVPSVEAPRATAVPGPAQTGPRHVPGAHGVLDRVSGAQQRQEVTVSQDPQQESFDPRIPEAPVEVSAIPVIRSAHADSDPVTSPVPAVPDAALDPVETDAGTGMVEMSTEPVADSPLTQPPLSEPVTTSVLAPADGDGRVPAPQAVPDPDANALEAFADAALHEPQLEESGFADAPFAVPGERSRGRRLPRPRLRRSPKPAADPNPDRVVYGEHMPTQAIALVERLGSSAYGRRMRSRLSARKADQDAAVDARTTLDFALKLGETMFSFGASSMDVESSIIVVTQAFGIHEIEIDLTNQAISLNYAPDSSRGEVPYTLQRVVRSWSTNFAGLGLLHRLVEEIADGETTRAEAQRRLVEIRRTPKPFPAWSEVIMAGVFCGLFVPFIGGTWRGALVGMVSTWIVFWLKIKVEKRGLPEIFSTMLGSFLATTIALTLHAVNVGIDPSLVIAGGIMILLPSSRFVAAVQDAINGFPLTAAGRLTSALLGYMGLMGGIMIGVIGSEIAGLPTLDLAEAPTGSELPAIVLMLLVACAAMSDSIVEQATWKALIASGLVASAAYGVWLLFDGIGTGPRLTPAIAAMAVGFLGRIAALRLGFPQIVVVLPSMLFLLPGLAIFRALYEFTVESGSTLLGVAGIFNATVVVAAIAGGVVFGDILARPLTDRIFVGSRPATGVGHVR
ncbi:hypothetical protein CEQ11_003720 [Micrococcus sp. FDAARGOS_333]|nr:hypothetical protein CEQ11_003720 [Micrococcus sp. FDAARGOS_333]